MTMTGGPAVLPFAREGRLRALAVSSTTRLTAAPELPTIADAALPGFEASQWYGIVAPAGTPERGGAAAQRRGAPCPERTRPRGQAGPRRCEPWPTSPVEFKDIIVADMARWGKLIRENGIRVE